MKIIKNPEIKDWSALLKRPTKDLFNLEDEVLSIFNDVKNNGDTAIKRYTEKFDGITLNNIIENENLLNTVDNEISEDLKKAISVAKQNIEKFHAAQKQKKVSVTTSEGINCWQETKAIEKVGIYIPAGSAPLFSTVLMLAIPAKIAGCKDIILCSPPNKQGEIAKEILYTAKLCGINKVIKVGGIQAIAGLTFGTESIPKVYKIFGPGNQYVTVAKQIATKFGLAIDMPAGPSELLIVADNTAKANYVASDLLSQAEHGEDSQVVLVSKSEQLLTQVISEINIQINELPRKDIAKRAMVNSKFILLKNDEEIINLINFYGPEHFIINTSNETFYTNNIVNAGSVFVGNYTPESAGDYASGTNHTLPTNGFSKAYSGVNLSSFTKTVTFQKISKTGLKNIGPTIELLAEAEGLQAHKNAVSIRLKDLNKT